MAKYGRMIDEIFNAAAREAAMIGASVDFDGEGVFSFADYPNTQRLVGKLLSGLHNNIEATIVNGANAEWTLANNKNSELCRRVFGDNIGRMTKEQYKQFFSNNDEARKAFLARKEGGLNLSDRVWRYTDQFKSDIELGLDIGIRDGLDAASMARRLQQYLRHPDMLFRRVRDEHGDLVLSKRASEFHPGQGVYRSSYKNALRLTRTETNMAYHTSDYDRWQQLDFVVGIEISLSGNHTSNGKPLTDICDELQGRYPKDFKFTGWHPQCRCQATTILKTEQELMEENRAILNGEEPSHDSVNKVDDVPDNFIQWVAKNEERAAEHYTMPYFVRDNQKYIPKDMIASYGSRLPYDSYAEYEAAMKYNKKNAKFSDEIRKNIEELNKVMPVMQGKIMNFTEADGGLSNPNYNDKDAGLDGYVNNCQTCTVSYELRRRGFNVEAMPNPVKEGYEKMRDIATYFRKHGMTWEDRFITADGKRAMYDWSTNAGLDDTDSAKIAFVLKKTMDAGRYEVYCGWKKGYAHVFVVERTTSGDIIWYDPQSGKKGDEIKAYMSNVKAESIGVTRIDDKLINPKFAGRLIKAGK